jgi:hypothetical protein
LWEGKTVESGNMADVSDVRKSNHTLPPWGQDRKPVKAHIMLRHDFQSVRSYGFVCKKSLFLKIKNGIQHRRRLPDL